MPTVRDLSFASLACVREKRKEDWLNLFNEDGWVQDPVGPSPRDPKGEGYRGRAGLSKFWDTTISAHKRFDAEVRQSFMCGNEVANCLHMTILTPEDRKREFDLIVIYRMADNGKLDSLRAFWEFPTGG